MKARPILFRAAMVRAILAGRKTVTRRLKFECEAGDLLWVKETFSLVDGDEPEEEYAVYRADIRPEDEVEERRMRRRGHDYHPWRPSIFMPRIWSRITLRVTSVRLEPLHAITEADARAEGAYWRSGADVYSTAREAFRHLWDSINGKTVPWASNPDVRRIAFEVIREPDYPLP